MGKRALTRGAAYQAFPQFAAPFAGVYGLDKIGGRMKAHWANIPTVYSGNQRGGVDIVCLGDSTVEGYNAAALADNWVHLLKLALQKKYNVADVPGGYGYHVACAGVSGSTFAELVAGTTGSGYALFSPAYVTGAPTGDQVGRASGYPNGTALRALYASSVTTADTGALIGLVCNGSAADASRRRRFIDKAEIVWRDLGTGAVAGVIRLDVSTTGALKAVAGTSGSLNFTGALVQGARAVYSETITRTNNNVLQATFKNGALGAIQVEGWILYDGDYTAGVRVHNLGHGSKTVGDYASGNQLLMNVTRFAAVAAGTAATTAATSGAVRGALFPISLIMNQVFGNASSGGARTSSVATATGFFGTSVNLSWTAARAQYITDLTAICTAIKNAASAPSILFVVPFVPSNISGYQSDLTGRWMDVIADTKQVIAASGVGALIEMNEYVMGRSLSSVADYDAAITANANYLDTDRIHPTPIGHALISQAVEQCISLSMQNAKA